jgi:hypothetical protein
MSCDSHSSPEAAISCGCIMFYDPGGLPRLLGSIISFLFISWLLAMFPIASYFTLVFAPRGRPLFFVPSWANLSLLCGRRQVWLSWSTCIPHVLHVLLFLFGPWAPSLSTRCSKGFIVRPFVFDFSGGCRFTPSPTSKALCYQMFVSDHTITGL